MELSREYAMINKATTGEIVIVDLGRKGDVRAFILTEEKQIANASTIKKVESIDEILNQYIFEFDWFKNSEITSDYKFYNLCYFTEKSQYGKGSENRKKSK